MGLMGPFVINLYKQVVPTGLKKAELRRACPARAGSDLFVENQYHHNFSSEGATCCYSDSMEYYIVSGKIIADTGKIIVVKQYIFYIFTCNLILMRWQLLSTWMLCFQSGR